MALKETEQKKDTGSTYRMSDKSRENMADLFRKVTLTLTLLFKLLFVTVT